MHPALLPDLYRLPRYARNDWEGRVVPFMVGKGRAAIADILHKADP